MSNEPVTVAACFWCSALLEPAPKRNYQPGILDYEPCPTCKATMSAADCTVLEVEAPRPDGAPEFYDLGVAPTGRWATLTEDQVRATFPANAPAILTAKRALIEKAIFDANFKAETT